MPHDDNTHSYTGNKDGTEIECQCALLNMRSPVFFTRESLNAIGTASIGLGVL